MFAAVAATVTGRSNAVNCYTCISTNYARSEDTCLEDSFDEHNVALLTDCDCCRVSPPRNGTVWRERFGADTLLFL